MSEENKIEDAKRKGYAKRIGKPTTIYEEDKTESPSSGTCSPTDPNEKRISKKGFVKNPDPPKNQKGKRGL